MPACCGLWRSRMRRWRLSFSFPGQPAIRRPPWLPGASWLLSGFVGLLLGVSVGVLTGLVKTDLLSRPVPLGIFVLVGIAAAFLAKAGLKALAREASQRYWLGHARSSWLGWALSAVGAGGLVLLMDGYTEREGLLSFVRLQQLAASLSGGGSAVPEGIYLLVAMLLTFGYVLSALAEGYFSGRHDVCWNRLVQLRETRIGRAEEAQRSAPQVQVALYALGKVREALRQQAFLEARIRGVEGHFAGLRREAEAELPAAIQLRLQDLHDQLIATQAIFDGELEEAIRRVQGRAGWLWWLLDWLRSRRVARRAQAALRRRG